MERDVRVFATDYRLNYNYTPSNFSGAEGGGQILDKTTENDGALFCFQFETDYNFNLVLFFFLLIYFD